jgi:hypothetical protein
MTYKYDLGAKDIPRSEFLRNLALARDIPCELILEEKTCARDLFSTIASSTNTGELDSVSSARVVDAQDKDDHDSDHLGQGQQGATDGGSQQSLLSKRQQKKLLKKKAKTDKYKL